MIKLYQCSKCPKQWIVDDENPNKIIAAVLPQIERILTICDRHKAGKTSAAAVPIRPKGKGL